MRGLALLFGAVSLFGAETVGRYLVLVKSPLAASQTEIAATQERVRQAAATHGITITGSTSVVSNVLFVRATAKQAEYLRTLPDVEGVRPSRTKYRH